MSSVIILVNFAFSIAGFIFIFRCWRDRREDMRQFSEGFEIPRGKPKRERKRRREAIEVQPSNPSVDEIAAAVMAAMGANGGQAKQANVYGDGDMDKLVNDMLRDMEESDELRG